MASQIVALLLALTVDSEDSVNKAHKLVNSVTNFIIGVITVTLCCWEITNLHEDAQELFTDVYTEMENVHNWRRSNQLTETSLSSLSSHPHPEENICR